MAEGITAMTWLAVFMGGGVGSVLRFGLGQGLRAVEVRLFSMGGFGGQRVGDSLARVVCCDGRGALGTHLPHVVLHDGRRVWWFQHLFDVCLGHLALVARRRMGVGVDQCGRLRGGLRGGQLVGGPNHVLTPRTLAVAEGTQATYLRAR